MREFILVCAACLVWFHVGVAKATQLFILVDYSGSGSCSSETIEKESCSFIVVPQDEKLFNIQTLVLRDWLADFENYASVDIWFWKMGDNGSGTLPETYYLPNDKDRLLKILSQKVLSPSSGTYILSALQKFNSLPSEEKACAFLAIVTHSEVDDHYTQFSDQFQIIPAHIPIAFFIQPSGGGMTES